MGQTFGALSGSSGAATPWQASGKSPSEERTAQHEAELRSGYAGPVHIPAAVRDIKLKGNEYERHHHMYNRRNEKALELLQEATKPMRFSLLGPLYLVVREMAGRLDHLVPPYKPSLSDAVGDGAVAETLGEESLVDAYRKYEYSATPYGGAVRRASMATEEDMKQAREEVYRRVQGQLMPAAEACARESPYASEALKVAATELLARESLEDMEQLAGAMNEVYAEVALWFTSAFYDVSHSAFELPTMSPGTLFPQYYFQHTRRQVLSARRSFVSSALENGLVTQVTGKVLKSMEDEGRFEPQTMESLQRIFSTAAKAVHDGDKKE